ncbi:MAG: shikimate dehydrogenase [Vicingaceae bacterium]
MRVYGLIGNPLSHSFSKKYFTDKFIKDAIQDSTYQLFELDQIDELINLIKVESNLKGLNVTIPFKQSVIPLLDEIDHTAKTIGAINTIKVTEEKKLIGYNTDAIGFRESLRPFLAKEHQRALILGTGGAAKAVAFVLKQIGIPFYFVSRSEKPSLQTIHYNDLDHKAIETFRLIINCTPVGMYPNTDKTPPLLLDGVGSQHLIYDLIYNPEETKLLAQAKAKGALAVNGLSMLRLQAETAWKIWNSKD